MFPSARLAACSSRQRSELPCTRLRGTRTSAFRDDEPITTCVSCRRTGSTRTRSSLPTPTPSLATTIISNSKFMPPPPIPRGRSPRRDFATELREIRHGLTRFGHPFGALDAQQVLEDSDVVTQGRRVLHLRYRVRR